MENFIKLSTRSDSSTGPSFAHTSSPDLAILADLVPAAIELANTRASKVIAVRQEQHAGLDLPTFFTFFDQSWSFVVQSEVLARRMVVSLRGVMVNQVSRQSAARGSFYWTADSVQNSLELKLIPLTFIYRRNRSYPHFMRSVSPNRPV